MQRQNKTWGKIPKSCGISYAIFTNNKRRNGCRDRIRPGVRQDYYFITDCIGLEPHNHLIKPDGT
jgi:hypothetical protein